MTSIEWARAALMRATAADHAELLAALEQATEEQLAELLHGFVAPGGRSRLVRGLDAPICQAAAEQVLERVFRGSSGWRTHVNISEVEDERGVCVNIALDVSDARAPA